MKKTITLLSLFLAMQSFSQDIDSGLLLYYPMDGNVNDLSGNDFHGTSYGVTYTEDRFGIPDRASYFNGEDNFLLFPNLSELKPNLPVSFSFWIKYAGDSYQDHVVFNTSMQENESSGVVFNAQSNTNKYVINCADGSTYYAPETRRSYVSEQEIDTENWHHISIVVNSEIDMQIYVDCEETGGIYSGEGGSLGYSLAPGCIGKHDRSLSLPPDFFHGYIDEFRYWNRALSIDDINYLCSPELSVTTTTNSHNIKIYPNPADEILYIESAASENLNVQIFNSLGQLMYSNESNSPVDISNFSAGLYSVKIESALRTETKKLIVK